LVRFGTKFSKNKYRRLSMEKRRVLIKMPMGTYGGGKPRVNFADYHGTEEHVDGNERDRFRTARLFSLENTEGKSYTFRLSGNGEYTMSGSDGREVARGSMMDPIMPQIINK
jgi:hypothetical protein